MDKKSFQVLEVLAGDARLSFNALARRVGLSPPAVAERVRRLEEDGVLLGYRVQLERNKIGLPIGTSRLSCSGASFKLLDDWQRSCRK